jgi:hypothetical protein
MAKFGTDGDIELIITPREFIQNCSARELLQLRELAKDEFDLVDSTYVPEEVPTRPPSPRCFGQMEFNNALVDLGESWYSITKTDEEIVLAIAKKHHTI